MGIKRQLADCAVYWMRTQYTHSLLHVMKEGDRSLETIEKKGEWFEFQMYVAFWLEPLLVAFEGCRRLRLEDAKLDHLIPMHVRGQKGFRDAEYHFDPVKARSTAAVLKAINWVEELHAEFERFFDGKFPPRRKSRTAAMCKCWGCDFFKGRFRKGCSVVHVRPMRVVKWAGKGRQGAQCYEFENVERPNRVGGFLAVSPSHTTEHTHRTRRFPAGCSAA